MNSDSWQCPLLEQGSGTGMMNGKWEQGSVCKEVLCGFKSSRPETVAVAEHPVTHPYNYQSYLGAWLRYPLHHSLKSS